jgi:hypothetical protein
LARTVSDLTRRNKIVYIYPGNIDYNVQPTACVDRRVSDDVNGPCRRPIAEGFESNIFSEYFVARLESLGANFIDPRNYFCDDTSCRMAFQGKLYYRDDNHLNVEGANWLVNGTLRDSPRLRNLIGAE